MTEETLGKVAGLVWSQLRSSGAEGISLSNLKKLSVGRPDEILAAVGWLAREGKLSFDNSTKGRIKVSLREHERSYA